MGQCVGAVWAFTDFPNGDIVAGGHFSSLAGAPAVNVARWDGAKWAGLGAGLGLHPSNWVNALTVLPNGDLIAGGHFDFDGSGPEGIARWDGTAWSDLGAKVEGETFALATSASGDLIAAGSIFKVGGVPVIGGMSHWNGQAWSDVGSGSNDYVFSLAVTPDDELLAAGEFTIASGVLAPLVARYGCRHSVCQADCDQSGSLDIDDFICFQTRYAIGVPEADCDGNGEWNIDDFICFQTAYAIGC